MIPQGRLEGGWGQAANIDKYLLGKFVREVRSQVLRFAGLEEIVDFP